MEYLRTLEGTGLTRRALLKVCLSAASLLAMPSSLGPVMASIAATGSRRPAIWLSFQECTGCTESLTRADAPTLERLLFEFLSLDYHHTLQAAAGDHAEIARLRTMSQHPGEYLLFVDGSVPTGANGAYSTIGGVSNLDLLWECASNAAAVIAVGTCAAFGGLPKAAPNPTGAMDVAALMRDGKVPMKPLINLPGCPPIPDLITAVLIHFLVFERFPALDDRHRPVAFYGATVHDRCNRYHHFVAERFAGQFGDEGSRKGWCLLQLGCRGPVTHNACPTLRWNQRTSYPIESGHPCIGCSEPDFWDRDGFYGTLPQDTSRIREQPVTPQERGEAIFDDSCVYCHLPSRKPFETSAQDIPSFLRRSNIRAHSAGFTDAQLADLVSYLKTLGDAR